MGQRSKHNRAHLAVRVKKLWWLAVISAIACGLLILVARRLRNAGDRQPETREAFELNGRAERQRYDETVWAAEVQAQHYERPISRLWDALRTSDNQWAVLAAAIAPTIRIGSVVASEDLELGICRYRFDTARSYCFTETHLAALPRRDESLPNRVSTHPWPCVLAMWTPTTTWTSG